MPVKLTGPHQSTYDSIFHHPMSHDLDWKKVISMFGELGEVSHEHNGNLKISRNGHTLSLRPGSEKEVSDMTALTEIRHFIRNSVSETEPHIRSGDHLLVVIDHHEARIYKSLLKGSIPERIVPYDPHGFGKHLHNVHDHSKGQHHPVPKSFFESVGATLKDASQIVMFGNGSGGRSAMNELLADLQDHHRHVIEHVIGTQVVDETLLTDDELLAKAREFYKSRFRSS